MMNIGTGLAVAACLVMMALMCIPMAIGMIRARLGKRAQPAPAAQAAEPPATHTGRLR